MKKSTVEKGKRQLAKNFNTLQVLQVIYIPPSKISPNSYNPNRQSESEFNLLLKSMSEDGFTQPIVVRPNIDRQAACNAIKIDPASKWNEIDWLKVFKTMPVDADWVTIVDGEHRWRASQRLNYPEIPVVVTDMTDQQQRIATLRHNRARGTEDIDLTAQVMKELEQLGALEHAVDSLDLDEVEVQRLLTDAKATELAFQEFSNKQELRTEVANELLDSNLSESQLAAEQRRIIERKMNEAKSDEERQMIQRTMKVKRFVFAVSPDEAVIIDKALGNENPAKRLVEICQKLI